MVCPDYCAVDHLQAWGTTAAVVEGLRHQFPQARRRKAPKQPVNLWPFVEMLVQFKPSDTRPRNPENPIQNMTVVPRATTASGAGLDHERLKAGPFLVSHQTAYQNGFRKGHVESGSDSAGNPLCQHVLGVSFMPTGRTPALILNRWLTGLGAALS